MLMFYFNAPVSKDKCNAHVSEDICLLFSTQHFETFVQKITVDSSITYELDKEDSDLLVVTNTIVEDVEEVKAVRKFRRLKNEDCNRKMSVM